MGFIILLLNKNRFMKLKTTIFCGFLALFGLCTFRSSAQNVGIGFQVGEPTGLNLHFRNTTGAMRPDILLAWDRRNDDRDFFFINVHGLWFKRLGTKDPFNFYYGPGVFVGVRDHRKERNNETVIGFSGNFGLNYEFNRLDIFVQLTPRLSIVPGTDMEVGGGLGLRFFL